ncbi:MAG: amino acid adenylation domain-containing protein [Marinifilaceae bacterium]
MELQELLAELSKNKVKLGVEQDKLKIRIPKGIVINHLIDAVKHRRDEIIAVLKNTQYEKEFLIEAIEHRDYYNLSSAQKRLYLLQQLNPEAITYNMPYVIPLRKEVRKESIQKIVDQLLARHESLRTSFELLGENPVQRIHDRVDCKLESYCIEQSAEQRLRQEFVRPFDLAHAPLLRAALVEIRGKGQLLVIDMHHIVSDGVSSNILEHEFRTLYLGSTLPPLKLNYKDYSEWQQTVQRQKRIKAQETYWLKRFAGELPVLNLAADYVRPVMQSHEGSTVSFVLNETETESLKRLAREQDLTLYMSLFSAFCILLSRLSGQESIVVGTPVAGRSHTDVEGIVGMFVNTLAIRNEVKGRDTLRTFLATLWTNTLEAYQHQDYPFEDLVEQLGVERDTSRNPVFDVLFNLLDQSDRVRDLSVFDQSEGVHSPGISKFDLTLTAVDCGPKLLLSVEYCTKLFQPATIDRYIQYFRQIVHCMENHIDQKISDIELLGKEEKYQLLYGFNNTQTDFPQEKTIQQLFEEKVEQHPDEIALVSGEIRITYYELNGLSNQMAYRLIDRGVCLESIVALRIDRSVEMLVGILGILKAGGAYLPISIDYPEDRISYILKDSRAKVLLQAHGEFKSSVSIPVLTVDLDQLSVQGALDLKNRTDSRNLSYVIYTSGSTGVPKGVMIEHCSVINRLKWMQRYYPIKSGDVLLQKTPYTFDVSVWELFWWAFEGGTLSLLEPGGEKDPFQIVENIFEHRVSVLHFVPSMFEVFLSFLEQNRDFIPRLKSLRYVFCSGEELKVFHVIKFHELLGKACGCELVNLYGPTEATVDVTYFNCGDQDSYQNIPIGRPISNTQAYVLDAKSLRLQPIGVVGELCLSGVGLARGYMGRDELTLEKFISHPFRKGEKLYRTGDLARWLPDGNIEFLGRIDHQVKIRGFRIELGEIENILLQHENIKECVVVKRVKNGENYLCAYVVLAKILQGEEMRGYLSGLLPDYMVPAHFVVLDELPLTSNGKVNRKILPEPEIKADGAYVAPSGGLEEKLVLIWSEVLNIAPEVISVQGNFFALGGHSLKIVLLVSKIAKEFDVQVELAEVFKHPTIVSLAKLINSLGHQKQTEIRAVEQKEFYPISAAQERMFVQQMRYPESVTYNIPLAWSLRGELNYAQINNALVELTKVHESLRTVFFLKEGVPVQRVNQEPAISLEYLSSDEHCVGDLLSSLIQPFSLLEGPLCRMYIIRIEKFRYIMLFDVHHILVDGVSVVQLAKEFIQIYTGKSLPRNYIEYKDFTLWYNDFLKNERVKKQKEYWINRFKNGENKLSLPYDFPKPEEESFCGDTINFSIDVDLSQKLLIIEQEMGITSFVLFSSLFNLLLSKVCNQSEINIGFAIAGERKRELTNIVGMFVNMLVLKSNVDQDLSFRNFLIDVKNNLVEAYENQDYQYDELVYDLSLSGGEENPLFNVSFSFDSFSEIISQDIELDRTVLKIDRYKVAGSKERSKYDLTLNGFKNKEQYHFEFKYKTERFKRETITEMQNYFIEVISIVANNSSVKIQNVNLTPKLTTVSSESYLSLVDDFDI